MVSGVMLGAPTLRVRGDYLAIVTLGFGEIIRLVVTNIEWLGAAAGIKDIPHPTSIGPDPSRPSTRAACSTSRTSTWDGIVPSLDHDRRPHFLDLRRARRDPLLLAGADGR